jgi:SAM-dependent methyltransferase
VSSTWDAQRYEGKHSYVWKFGASLLELLQPRGGERILDVGCGTGQLTAEIAKCGAYVVGLDNSEDMLRQARQNYPALTFVLGDATRFRFEDPFDAIFSNAALHWVKDAAAAVESIALALRPGGRFVAEFGGKDNIASIQAAFRAVFGPAADARSPWFYPSIGKYTPLLERYGLEVREASLFDRPTALEGDIEDWFRMFCASYLRDLAGESADEKIGQLAAHLRPTNYRDGVWTIDYRRLRILAVKLSHSSVVVQR